jgi:hypothetical protein
MMRLRNTDSSYKKRNLGDSLDPFIQTGDRENTYANFLDDLYQLGKVYYKTFRNF